MHLLLVAYDFPPIPSPQALRWAYLVRELARAGHCVEVIAPDVPGYGRGGLPELPPEVRIHRVEPGRVTRLLLGRRQEAHKASPTASSEAPQVVQAAMAAASVPGEVQQLNWKGRLRQRLEQSLGVRDGLNLKGELAERIKSMMSRWMFPDYRAEWVPFANARLDALLRDGRPDAVVVSHEPACSLPVGLHAARCGIPLVVDMGDPVLAPYTPERWKEEALRLEREVCKAAVMVSVTTEAAADVLTQRHDLPSGRVLVVRQGFDPEFKALDHERQLDFDPSRLELLYTGSFYSFRRAETLLEAVVSLPDVRLTVATISAPDYLVQAADKHPESIRLVGFMPHRAALAAQRDCDVLLNIANADPVQVPGKVCEYLGAGKPVLHLRGSTQDATGALITSLKAGWDIPTEGPAIAASLRELRELHREQRLEEIVGQRNDVQAYAWSSLARKWAAALHVHLQLSSANPRLESEVALYERSR